MNQINGQWKTKKNVDPVGPSAVQHLPLYLIGYNNLNLKYFDIWSLYF